MVPRLAAIPIGALAAACVLASNAAAAPLPPAGSAAVVTQTSADGARSVTISAGDGRFAERDYDARGALAHELVIARDTLTEYTPSRGTVVHHGDVGVSENRIDQWESQYRDSVRRGTLRLVGEDVVDGHPVHVLALGALPAQAKFAAAPPSAAYRLYVDAVTWVPLRATDGAVVRFTATEQVVPVGSVERQLVPSRAAKKAARSARRHHRH
jgi:hypothetical protein